MRKLASVQIIKELIPIDGADRIEVACEHMTNYSSFINIK